MGGGYKDPPWTFTGRAVYQLQLVPSKEARKYVPEQLHMVEAFGWTLGGLYLARYDDSPVGPFDEMVVLAGLVWNAPTSCAWASRVMVNSRAARDHGLKAVGLPSSHVTFEQSAPEYSRRRRAKRCWWAEGRAEHTHTLGGDVRLVEHGRGGREVCTVGVPGVPPAGQWRGPHIRLALPSFSGLTPQQPQLLQYACDMRASLRLSAPMTLRLGAADTAGEEEGGGGVAAELARLFVGPRLLTVAFDHMRMRVEKPAVVQARVEPRVERRAYVLAPTQRRRRGEHGDPAAGSKA